MKEINFNDPSNQYTLGTGLTYYSQKFDFKDSKQWALDWISKNLPEEHNRLSSIKEHRFSNRGYICRMIKNGLKITESQKQDLIRFFKNLQEETEAKEESESHERKPIQKDPQVIYLLEDAIDDILSDKEPCQEIKVPEDKRQAKILLQWIERNLIEYQEMEAKARRISNLLISVYDKLQESKPEMSLLDKKKQAAKINYLKEYPPLRFTSLSPVKIIDARYAILFNPTSKVITVLYAEKGKSLDIPRLTIQNYDKEKSFSKVIRKPIDFFTMGWEKKIETIQTKPREASNRITDDTLILVVNK